MKISIIIPIYNAEKYLHKCIGSILNQSFTGFELILVNDGSLDNSGVICDQYALNDDRIRVFHKQNGGVSSARNTGLDMALGEWICFIDADDYVGVEYLNDFVKVGLTKEMLIVQEVVKATKIVPSYKYGTWSCDSILDILHNNAVFANGYPFCKLYNRSIINANSIRFDENLKFCEDIVFYLAYIIHVQDVCFLNKASYYYAVQETSASTKIFTFEQYMMVIAALEKVTLKIVKGQLWKEIEQIRSLFGMLFFLALLSIFYKNNRYSCYSRIDKMKQLTESNNFAFIESYINKRSTKIIELFFYKNILKNNFKIVDFLFPIYFNLYKLVLNAK